MNKLFDKTGVKAVGTRMRVLSERVLKESEKIYELYGVDIKPKWYPVVFLLLDTESTTVTQIAQELGFSHVAVVKIVQEMSKAGMLDETKDENDKRKTNISFSSYGRERIKGLKSQHIDAEIVLENMIGGMKHNLWLALEEFENLLDVESTYPRMLKQMRKRESDSIEIVSYKDIYKNDFKKLNQEWIEESFTMEEKDIKVLDNPQELIINKGGAILVALYESKAIAVCSLVKLNDSKYDFELAKMVVEKEYQRKGIGFMLANVAIDKAKELGAKSIFIETNVVLTPAMSMYKKLGFQQVMNYQSDYERSNYAMELIL